MKLLNDFISLLYPKICILCGNTLFKNEEIACTLCLYKLPRTNFHLLEENPVSKVFWGRVKVEHASSFLYFRKKGIVQTLIHHFKYKGRKDIGVFLGKLYGHELSESKLYDEIDYIIPVPLHKKKLLSRGYNQSDMFAYGLNESMGIEVLSDILYRKKHSSTQTKKSRFERWENVEEIFELKEAERIRNKHILLVDDVITTGATLEACIQILKQVKGLKVSVVTIAFAL